MALRDVYDGAFFHYMSGVPANVKAIAGYVGGPGAYHVWPPSDAQKVRDSGREFWSIWVPPQRTLNSADGSQAAHGMIAAMSAYDNPKTRPVFLNIEYKWYVANPDGADAAGKSFASVMHNAGYPRAYSYVPLLAGYGWGAKYNYQRPSALPAGVIGIQYENDRYQHPGWDASVFDPSLFGSIDSPTLPDPPDTFDLESIMAALNHVWWFARLDSGAIYAVNALNGTYRRMPSPTAMALFKESLVSSGVPFNASNVSVDSITPYGVEVKDAS